VDVVSSVCWLPLWTSGRVTGFRAVGPLAFGERGWANCGTYRPVGRPLHRVAIHRAACCGDGGRNVPDVYGGGALVRRAVPVCERRALVPKLGTRVGGSGSVWPTLFGPTLFWPTLFWPTLFWLRLFSLTLFWLRSSRPCPPNSHETLSTARDRSVGRRRSRSRFVGQRWRPWRGRRTYSHRRPPSWSPGTGTAHWLWRTRFARAGCRPTRTRRSVPS
jgi:hypothetical protein